MAALASVSVPALAQEAGAVPGDRQAAPAPRDATAAGETPDAPNVSAAGDQGDVTTPSTGDPAIVVTGSRIQTGNSSPTPVTIVKAQTLEAVSPATIADGLNKLPQFVGSNNQSTNGNASSNAVGNFLNLRGLGTTRTLILFDGHRVPDTAQAGGVDVNTIPQFLLERVDVVTGGASAVYGSDAVAGVVNFVVDKKFTGLKFQAEAGLSDRNDNGTQKFGIGYGGNLFGERGHILLSYNYVNSEGIDSKTERKNGALVPNLGGNGSAANPFVPVLNTRFAFATEGGLITSGPLQILNQFGPGGTIIPVNTGVSAGGGLFSGGDFAFFDTALLAGLETHQGYGRFDFDFTDHISAYVQGTYTRSTNNYPFIQYLLSGQVLPTNPFLAPSAQATLAPGGVFTVSKATPPYQRIASRTDSYFLNGGLKGDFAGGNLNWDVSYTHAQTKQRTATLFNVNNEKMSAALDAVQAPNGQIVCRITLIDPTRFPGCVPINLFGVGSVTPAALDFVTDKTEYVLTQRMDDVNATLAGTLIELPAGPLKFAINGEYRKTSLNLVSNAQPLDHANCTNLTLSCTSATTRYRSNVVANATGSEQVTEGAVEVAVPLLKDHAFFHSLSLSGAARYTHYNTSGSVATWKVGGDWEPVEGLRLRATRSRDIRAPNLNELFAPLNSSPTGFPDIHIAGGGAGRTTTIQTGGNPTLHPEKADTFTAGVIYQPGWLPRFSVAIDYYNIRIKDAISFIPAATSNAICEASGGTDPLCANIVRPLPFSDRTAANYPTLVISQPLNAASFRQSGIDTEINYAIPVLSGNVSIRALATYVRRQESQQFTSSPVVDTAGVINAQSGVAAPRWRVSLFTGYSDERWSLTTLVRYRSPLVYNKDPRFTYNVPKIPSAVFVDATIGRKVHGPRGDAEFYISIQNLFDKTAPIFYPNLGAPGFQYPAVPGDDIIGRRLNFGVRGSF